MYIGHMVRESYNRISNYPVVNVCYSKNRCFTYNGTPANKEFVELLIYSITLWDIMEPCST